MVALSMQHAAAAGRLATDAPGSCSTCNVIDQGLEEGACIDVKSNASTIFATPDFIKAGSPQHAMVEAHVFHVIYHVTCRTMVATHVTSLSLCSSPTTEMLPCDAHQFSVSTLIQTPRIRIAITAHMCRA